MRHRVAGVKLGRTPAHRRALLRNLVTALLEHEVVRTTDAKAKELRRWGDRVITLGKQGTLHARRRAASLIRRRSVVRKLFDEIAPRFAERAGGGRAEGRQRARRRGRRAAAGWPGLRRSCGGRPGARALELRAAGAARELVRGARREPRGGWSAGRAAPEHWTGPRESLTRPPAAHTSSAMPAPRVPDPHPDGGLWRRGGGNEAPR